MPELSVTPGNSSVSFSGNYTLAMVDAGPVRILALIYLTTLT